MIDEAMLKNIMATVLKTPVEHINADTSMDTVENWDSFQHMNLVLALEDAFEVRIPDDDATNITSYALIKLVLEQQLKQA